MPENYEAWDLVTRRFPGLIQGGFCGPVIDYEGALAIIDRLHFEDPVFVLEKIEAIRRAYARQKTTDRH